MTDPTSEHVEALAEAMHSAAHHHPHGEHRRSSDGALVLCAVTDDYRGDATASAPPCADPPAQATSGPSRAARRDD